jgi:hypothetical protein
MTHLHLRSLAMGILVVILAACAPLSLPWSRGLVLEEHALVAAPESIPLTFQPLQGTQDDILAKHARDRSQTYSSVTLSKDGKPAMQSVGDSDELLAVIVSSAENPLRQIAKVYRGDQEIFSVDAGMPSPAVPLQGLWTYDGHWALELVYSDQDLWIGRIYIDGELINDAQGYGEAFGFQLLDGKPFYFFTRNGTAGYSFDGKETDLGYEEVIHYRCCAESTLNPVQAQKMVAFFAARDSTWYYVELGRFNS